MNQHSTFNGEDVSTVRKKGKSEKRPQTTHLDEILLDSMDCYTKRWLRVHVLVAHDTV